MDIYERARPAKKPEPNLPEQATKKVHAKKQKMSLAMLHAMSSSQLKAATSNSNSNSAHAVPLIAEQQVNTSAHIHTDSILGRSAINERSAVVCSSQTAAATPSPLRPGNSLPSTSLALTLHFLPLPNILAFARCCRDWYQLVATNKLCWSGGKALLRVKGSREERRRMGEVEQLSQRNFNPNEAHNPNYNRNNSTTKSVVLEEDLDPRSQNTFLTHPLLYASCQPLFRHVRHLSYSFSPPTIRTSLASLWSEDMFECDVIAAELPFAHLPKGVFLFLSSVALRDISLCTQLSIQSAFQRFGVQSHSFLRALLLHVSPVLSASEQANTLNAMIREVGAQLSNLEIFQCTQRTLPASISFQPLLSLTRLHTLIFHSSLEKTPDRLEIIKALALHSSLKHLEWPLWTASQIKILLGGVAHALSDEVIQEETLRAMARDASSQQLLAEVQLLHLSTESATIDHNEPVAGQDDDEEVIIGLDADEDIVAIADPVPSGVNVLLSSLSPNYAVPQTKAHFGFEEWTIDHGVSNINLIQYWCVTPSLFPQLHTISFVEPQNFASMSPFLSRMLANLPNLTATRFHVSFYALGDFWRQMSLKSLNQLKAFELNHLSLVSSNSSSVGVGPILDVDEVIQRGLFQLEMWNCLSNLRVLSLAHLVMPIMINSQDSSLSLARSCPLLEEIRLEKVVFREGGRAGGTTFDDFLSQLRLLQHLKRLELYHLPPTSPNSEDVFQSSSATLHQLLTCDSLESFVYCNQSLEPTVNAAAHRSVHDQWCAHMNRRWKSCSVYFFEDEEDAASSIPAGVNSNSAGSIPSTSAGSSNASSLRVKKTQLNGNVGFSRVHQQLVQVQTLIHQRRRDLKLGQSHADTNIVGLNIHYWNEEHSCYQFLPAVKL